eukprot:257650_1
MKLQDEETNDEYKSPVNRTKLRSTVCLINPNTKNTIMMQKKYPKSAPITSMDKSNMNKNNSLHPQLPLSCTLGPIATNKDESKCVITTHATHKTVLIIDWDDTLLPSYYLQEIGLRPSTKQQSPSDKTPHKELSEPQKLYVLLSLKKLEKLVMRMLLLLRMLNKDGLNYHVQHLCQIYLKYYKNVRLYPLEVLLRNYIHHLLLNGKEEQLKWC